MISDGRLWQIVCRIFLYTQKIHRLVFCFEWVHADVEPVERVIFVPKRLTISASFISVSEGWHYNMLLAFVYQTDSDKMFSKNIIFLGINLHRKCSEWIPSIYACHVSFGFMWTRILNVAYQLPFKAVVSIPVAVGSSSLGPIQQATVCLNILHPIVSISDHVQGFYWS